MHCFSWLILNGLEALHDHDAARLQMQCTREDILSLMTNTKQRSRFIVDLGTPKVVTFSFQLAKPRPLYHLA